MRWRSQILAFLCAATILMGVAVAETRSVTLSAEEVGTLLAEVSDLDYGSVQLSPNGRWVVYVVARRSLATNQFWTESFVQRVPQGSEPLAPPVKLPARTTTLRWHPSSRSLGMFIDPDPAAADNAASHRRFVSYDVDTGVTTSIHPREATTADVRDSKRKVESVGDDYQWSPSGNDVAFTSDLPLSGGVNPRRGVSRTDWKRVPNRGLFVLNVSTGRWTQVSPDSISVHSFCWSPDEAALGVAILESPGVDPGPHMGTDVIVIDRSSGAMRPLVTQPGRDDTPVWSPDGASIAFFTQSGKRDYTFSSHGPAVVSARGGSVMTLPDTGTPDPFANPALWWTADSRAFYYTSALEMTTRLVRADVSQRRTGALPRTAGDTALTNVDGYSMSADGRWLAYARSSLATPAEVFVVAVGANGGPAGTPRQVTQLTRALPLGSRVHAERLSWPSPDGRFTIDALLLTPAASRVGGHAKGPLPTLLYFMGGPSMVRPAFAREGWRGAPIALAARGYAVLVPNTRGRAGYGRAFNWALRDGKSKGRLPYEDAMAGLDRLIERGIADPARMGVFGHSYGGYLTEYAITQTTRFKAAVVHEAGQVEMMSATLYEPGTYMELLQRDLVGIHDPFDPTERARIIAESPGFNADRIETPTLLLFGAKAAAEVGGNPFFNVLRRFTVPSAFFIYDEGHVFNRPAAIADDLTRTAEWLDYWVRGIPFPDAERAREYNAWREERAHSK